MSRNRRSHSGSGPIYGFAVTWVLLSIFLPMYNLFALLTALAAGCTVAFLVSRWSAKKSAAREQTAQKAEEEQQRARQQEQVAPHPKKSYGPEIDPILEEGNRALAEMGRLYSSIKDPEVRTKINELMRVTDKITQDAIADPLDIPQIKKFLNYYLPTTIKLLNAYDRMSAQGIQGENLDKSMKSINEMLDAAIDAFKKQLDSLFANQALDIETDIEVMNTMLAREGLSGDRDFEV